jgi:hypothetical protein
VDVAALTLTELDIVVREFSAHCLDAGHHVGQPERAAILRQLRAELRRRVLELVNGSPSPA